jgi:hypothetical protein
VYLAKGGIDMKKLSYFIVFTIIISLLNVSTPEIYAASAFANSYGEQLSNEVSAKFYNDMVCTYIVKEGEAGNPDGRYTNLAKRISSDGRISYNTDNYPEIMLFEATADTQADAENAVNKWFETNYKTLLVYSSDAMHSFLRDYPQAFWIKGFKASATLNISTVYSSHTGFTSKGYMKFELIPVKLVEPNDYLDEFNERVIELTRTFKSRFANMDEATMIKEIHDYVAERVDYHYDAAASNTSEYDYAFSPLAVFINKAELGNKVVCQGYSKAFKIICDRMGIDNALLTGMAYGKDDSEYHMWNAVRINKMWYAVDVTWDDQKSGLVYTYFLAGMNTATRTSATYKTDHVAESVFAAVDGAKTFLIPKVSDKEMNVDYLVKREDFTSEEQKDDDTGTSTDGQDGKTDNDNNGSNSGGNGGKTINISVIYSKSATYSGKAVKNNLCIKFGNITLKEGKDYRVVYKNNVNVGKASFTVTFIGEYRNVGSFTKTFEIKKINMSNVTVKKVLIKKINMKKGKVTLKTTVKYLSNTLKSGKDFTMSIKINKKKRVVEITLKGKGNYTGKKVVKIKVK